MQGELLPNDGSRGIIVKCSHILWGLLIMIWQNSAETCILFGVLIANIYLHVTANSLEYNFAEAIIKAQSRYFCSHVEHVGSNLQEKKIITIAAAM